MIPVDQKFVGLAMRGPLHGQILRSNERLVRHPLPLPPTDWNLHAEPVTAATQVTIETVTYHYEEIDLPTARRRYAFWMLSGDWPSPDWLQAAMEMLLDRAGPETAPACKRY